MHEPYLRPNQPAFLSLSAICQLAGFAILPPIHSAVNRRGEPGEDSPPRLAPCLRANDTPGYFGV